MTDVATVTQLRDLPAGIDALASRETFEHMQRVAKVFCASELIPAHLKKNNGADALLALAIAKRMGEDPVSVCQNIYFVSGKAGWSASYMIARANRSGVFKGPIRWKTAGDGENMVVTARGRLAEIEGEDVEVSVSMKMAKAEGWIKNPKYNTMPEHMLRWRSATMLIRLYCPEVMMGMPTEDELTDHRYSAGFRDITTEGHATVAESVNAILQPTAAAVEQQPEQSQGVEDAPGARSWKLSADIVGQDNILKAIVDLLGITETRAEVDALEVEHQAFLDKLGVRKPATVRQFAERREELPG